MLSDRLTLVYLLLREVLEDYFSFVGCLRSCEAVFLRQLSQSAVTVGQKTSPPLTKLKIPCVGMLILNLKLWKGNRFIFLNPLFDIRRIFCAWLMSSKAPSAPSFLNTHERTPAPHWTSPGCSSPVIPYDTVSAALVRTHRITTELNCDLFMLVRAVLSPPVLLVWRAYQWQTRPVRLQGTNLPLPGRETVLGSGFTLLLAQVHAHINKMQSLHTGFTALPSLFSLSWRAE